MALVRVALANTTKNRSFLSGLPACSYSCASKASYRTVQSCLCEHVRFISM